MQCPVCRGLFLANPGQRCTSCDVELVEVRTRRRRRASPVTEVLTPDRVHRETTARLRALEAASSERVVYSWPDEILVEETQR